MYFNEKYNEFQNAYELNKTNIHVNSTYFPLLLRQFLKERISDSMMNTLMNETGNKKTKKNKLYFTIGSYIYPKFVMNSIE